MSIPLIEPLLNLGVTETTTLENKRQYRQVNMFGLFFINFQLMGIILLSILGYPWPFILFEIAILLLHPLVFLFTARHKLKAAQRYLLYFFELHTLNSMFVFFGKRSTGDFYSIYLSASFMIPVLAILVEESLILHTVITLCMFVVFYIGAPIIIPYYDQYILAHVYNRMYMSFVDAYMIFGTPVGIAGMVYIIHSENIRSRKEVQQVILLRQQEIEKRFQAVQLQEKAEQELKKKVTELEEMNKYMVGRELRMVELKEQLAQHP